jgi:hypothetical protein
MHLYFLMPTKFNYVAGILTMATAMLLSCTKTHMAVMADDGHPFQTEGSPNDQITILESVHTQESNREVPAWMVVEVPADGSRTDGYPVEVFANAGENMNQNQFNQQRRREAQTRREGDEANMRIRQLEELLAAAEAKQSLQTSVDCYGHAATLGHNNGNHSPHFFDASRLYSMNPVWVSLGVGTLLAGGYVARKVSCNFHAMRKQLATTKNQLATEIAEKRALEGQLTWSQYFGDVGAAPPLPANINEILNRSCPFWPGKLVKDTHLLVLVPATVNGIPFTLDLLGDLIKSPQGGGSKTEYMYYYGSTVQEELGAKSPGSSYWVLMTRDVLPDSRGKKYDAQEALVAAHASRLGLPYEMPDTLSAATAILLHHARTGERLYTDDPGTYTRCQEKIDKNRYPVVVGGFESAGLVVDDCNDDYSDEGVACCRKF